MAMPSGIRAIDLRLEVPSEVDQLRLVLEQMDAHGIERAMIRVDFDNDPAQRALKDHPDRFFASYEVDPNRGMDEVRKLVAAYEHFGLKAATSSPAGYHPQVPLNDKRFYPLYAKCVELDLPMCTSVGVPALRVPMRAQHPELVDEVCWFFPELRFVMRDGAEPWTALAVKLMLKWPNLYYMTSGLAPRDYPEDILHFANTRGADRIMYAGPSSSGASLERSLRELPDVPLRPPLWPRFLRENATRVFKL